MPFVVIYELSEYKYSSPTLKYQNYAIFAPTKPAHEFYIRVFKVLSIVNYSSMIPKKRAKMQGTRTIKICGSQKPPKNAHFCTTN